MVAAHSDADTVDFGLGESNSGNHEGVVDFAVRRNEHFGNKEDSVDAGGHADAYALGKTSYIVGKCLDPGGAVMAKY